VSGFVSGLRISALTVHTVRLPVRIKRRHGVGDVQDAVTNVVLRLDTDAGTTGFGEAAPWPVFTGTAEASAAALHVHLRPLLIGADPFRVEALLGQADRLVVGHPEAKAAMEAALLDLKGKALGVSAADLLGGRVRDEIPLSFSLANPDPAEDLATAKALYAEGIRLFKVKTGFAGHRADLARLERFRAELPHDVDLRVDYNQGLEPWDAIRRLKEVEAFRPTFIEQPVPHDQIAAMAAITRALDTPIMADESVFTPADALRVAQARAADLFSIKVMKHGGALRARAVSAIAEAAGIACYGGDMFESGLGHAAGAQLIAATPNIALGCEFYQARFFLTQDLLTEPFPIADGKVQVPTGPGLGVEIDEDRLARYSIERLA
jgi:muconate cycloisomerase